MKKTIKEDSKRIILKQNYLDDNNLLEYHINGQKVSLVVRYIEMNKIHEITLINMDFNDYLNELHNIVKINDDNNAVAIFKKDNNDEYWLYDIYKTEDHSLGYLDFLDIEYDNYFNKKIKLILNRRFI